MSYESCSGRHCQVHGAAHTTHIHIESIEVHTQTPSHSSANKRKFSSNFSFLARPPLVHKSRYLSLNAHVIYYNLYLMSIIHIASCIFGDG